MLILTQQSGPRALSEREGGKWVKSLSITCLDSPEHPEITSYLLTYCLCGLLEESPGPSTGSGRCADTINIVEWKEGRTENGRKQAENRERRGESERAGRKEGGREAGGGGGGAQGQGHTITLLHSQPVCAPLCSPTACHRAAGRFPCFPKDFLGTQRAPGLEALGWGWLGARWLQR